MLPFRDFKENGGDFSISEILSMVEESWKGNNIRFCNMSTPVTLVLFPKWLTNIITALFVVIMILFSAKLAKIESKKYLQFILLSFVIIFGLQWWDYVTIADYALNYVWTSAVGLVFLWVLFYRSSINKTVLIVLGFIAGGMHEGFTMPLLCGLIPYLLFNRKNITAKQWILLVSFIIGFIVIMTSPGKTSRLELTFDHRLAEWIYVLVFYNPLLLLLICLMIRILFKRGFIILKKIIKTPVLVYLFAAFAGYFMSVYIYLSGRVSWFSQLMAIIAIFSIWNSYFQLPKTDYLRHKIIAGLTIILIMIHLVVVDYYAFRTYNDYKQIMTSYKESPSQTIFYDYVRNEDISVLALGKVRSNIWNEEYDLDCINRYYGIDGNPITVVPKGLLNIYNYPVTKVAGNNPFYEVNNRHYVAKKGTITSDALYYATYKYIVDKGYRYMIIPFTDEKGRELLYCHAADGYLQSYFDELISLDKTDK